MTKSKIFLFLLLSFVVGVAVRSFAPIPYFLLWFGLMASVVSVVWGILQKQKFVILGGFLFLAILAGIFRFDQQEMSRPDLADFYGKPLVLQGVVAEEPERKENVQRLKVKVEGGFYPVRSRSPEATADPLADRTSNGVYTLVTTRRYPEYKIGDELELRGLLQKPENYSDFDYVSYLAKEDVFSTISFPLIEKIGEEKGSKPTIFLAKTKRAFEKKIDEVLPEPHSSFLKGLLLGERESLPQDLVENFKRTGTTHIVALSGYNITLVARFILVLLLFLTIPFYLSFWVASFAIILFVVMAGASPSVVRAGIMGILVLLAGREGRPYHITNALAFAGVLMLWQNPKILRFDAAFQLSFLATLGLVYLSPRVEIFLDRVRSKLSFLPSKLSLGQDTTGHHRSFSVKQVFAETLSAQLAVLPLLVFLFGRVSLISPLTNILVLVAVPYSMAAGFFAALLGFVYYPFGQVAGWVVWALLEYKLRVIDLFAKLPLASIEIKGWMIIPLAVPYLWLLWNLKNKKIGKNI